uniref:Uncharacterized protein n=1 Tax=Stegastes partitus TaxID=144197 RepID=A0A3B5BLR9_9TELE
LDQTLIGIYVIKHQGASVNLLPEVVGIIVKGVQVLSGLKDVATAFALLFGIIYGLNLKILMEFDTHRLSTKIQVLKNKLLDYMHEAVTVFIL